MIRLRRGFCALGILCALFSAGSVWAEEGSNLDVVMTVQVLTVYRFGALNVNAATGTSAVSDRILVQNTGNVNETFVIKITTVTGDWKYVETQPGLDEFRLSVIWHKWDIKPSTKEFQTNDILKLTEVVASTTTFFNEVDVSQHYPVGENVNLNTVNGVNVPPKSVDNARSIRYLFFRYDAPQSYTPGKTNVNMSYVVTAIASE
ncbi:MAG: hypothetical protein HYY63_04405 [Elusimicrobia bacterium]|nr:hypothetical protein [Elusimicrobiota bacterium]